MIGPSVGRGADPVAGAAAGGDRGGAEGDDTHGLDDRLRDIIRACPMRTRGDEQIRRRMQLMDTSGPAVPVEPQVPLVKCAFFEPRVRDEVHVYHTRTASGTTLSTVVRYYFTRCYGGEVERGRGAASGRATASCAPRRPGTTGASAARIASAPGCCSVEPGVCSTP